MVREKAPEPYERAITSASQVASLVQDLQDFDREKMLALHLDTKHRLICVDIVSIGTLTASLIHPREVFKTALLTNAASLILVHNHPSGNPIPSLEDMSITRRLADAGKILGIDLMDHVVVGRNGFSSLKELGGWS